jgi:DNA-binding MarR family transcriptional regulator
VARAAAKKAAAEPAPRAKVVDAPIPDFDRVIHEKTRLAMVSALAVNPTLSFVELRSLLNATDGNVSVHARKLEEAGYIHCKKSFAGRMPRTEYSLTAAGKKALGRYLDHMEALIKATRRT